MANVPLFSREAVKALVDDICDSLDISTHQETGPLPQEPGERRQVTIMAASWTVYVPDRSSAYPFPKTMEIEEIRSSLVATGVASVSSATYTVDGDVVRFNRVQGGSKGAN